MIYIYQIIITLLRLDENFSLKLRISWYLLLDLSTITVVGEEIVIFSANLEARVSYYV